MIPTSISQLFSASARDRGAEYRDQRRVAILEHTSDRLVARVRGTSSYDVLLHLTAPLVVGSCTCLHFRDGHACKHLWSVLLEADRLGVLKRPAGFELDWNLMDDIDDIDLDEQDVLDATQFLFGEPERRVPNASPQRARLPSAPARPTPTVSRPHAPRQPAWFELLAQMTTVAAPRPRAAQQLWYIVGPLPGVVPGLGVDIVVRERKANGDWGKPRSTSLVAPDDPQDTTILGLLSGGTYYHYPGAERPSHYQLGAAVWDVVLPMMCRTGRCSLSTATGELGPPINWDEGPPWSFGVEADLAPDGETLRLHGVLARDGTKVPLSDALLVLSGGLVVWPDRLSRLEDHGAFSWVTLLARHPAVPVPVTDVGRLLSEIARTPEPLPVALPESLSFTRRQVAARPRLHVRACQPHEYPRDQLKATLAFAYDDVRVDSAEPGHGVWLESARAIVERDRVREAEAHEQLLTLGVRPARYPGPGTPPFEIRPKELPRVVRELTGLGWQVEADGRLYRRAGTTSMAVRSGIDWFELHGTVDFDGIEVALPEVWRAVSRGETTVTLGDGTVGLLPEEWLGRHGLAAALGDLRDDHVRFARSQVGLVDVWLSAQPPVDCDAAFEQARAALRNVDGLSPKDAAASFSGELRHYQRDGLGWLDFLERCAFGGCLADDMGLGKTVQVLAHLDVRRAQGRQQGPSLAVVPRSLVFNWMDEARRFTPSLRVIDHTGTTRERQAAAFGEADLVLVTYGTLRRDIGWLKDAAFDYVVLDEAHAIKNAVSESAKVVRLLRARQRLALSGTPVQNHLGELWSLFEFLNPGMLGASQAFARAVGRKGLDDDTRASLARAVRPFVLRRTKEAVAPELPARVEQIVHCAMDAPQRKVYEKVLAQYRLSVGQKVASVGLAKSKMHVLEALLRLRQVACHPGLISERHASAGSAKLDVLFARVDEIIEEGHRALVFSQFTSLLAYVRRHLDARGIRYEYLDGSTRDREVRVKAFQEDERTGLFLISLKAGGLGLNLTAADYVFLLDPWWNPAVETQAIDRAHRIGQTRPVMAYRLIARDTVEEKILLLQEQKRALSASIVPSDDGLVKHLTEADLEFLFG